MVLSSVVATLHCTEDNKLSFELDITDLLNVVIEEAVLSMMLLLLLLVGRCSDCTASVLLSVTYTHNHYPHQATLGYSTLLLHSTFERHQKYMNILISSIHVYTPARSL